MEGDLDVRMYCNEMLYSYVYEDVPSLAFPGKAKEAFPPLSLEEYTGMPPAASNYRESAQKFMRIKASKQYTAA